MTKVFAFFQNLVWGVPGLALLLGVGILLTGILDVPQLRFFPRAVKALFRPPRKKEKGISSFQALCTALAATVGTGNLVGVAGAICLGGPGAIFWMWVCGFFGMATKYAEAVLAVHCRVKTGSGWSGGPMYAMQQLPRGGKLLAVVYSLFGIWAAFGVGNAAQVNAVVGAVRELQACFGIRSCAWGDILFGIALALLVGTALLGGVGRITSIAQTLVPFAAGGYILLCLGVLAVNWSRIPDAFGMIFQGIMTPSAVSGGVLGSAFLALRVGCSRGIFTNEAGMGTAAMAHASAQVDHPCEQGLMGIVEVFLDTIVICTLTALVILCSGVPIPYGTDVGGTLTTQAFSCVYGSSAAVFLSLAMILFALATILGWSLYGITCTRFLFGPKAWKGFVIAQILVVLLASVLDTAAVWQISELLNGLMAIPNLIILAALAPELKRLTKDYQKSGGKAVGGGNYADFHQCKPVRALSHAEIPSSGSKSPEGRQKNLPSEYWSA